MEKKYNKITKKDLSFIISRSTGLSAIYVKKIIEDLLNLMIIQLINNNVININNFGTFKILNKSKRIGRNPKDKIEYIILARKTISFRASKDFIKRLNNEF
tara:strand:+ start:5 stop:307 length:303 start_codon:yes stop_codon:yes gene_type:complete